jgi:hypothetical protein
VTRIYYYHAYLADEASGGRRVAPDCVGTLPNNRCNFEQFLAFIWEPMPSDLRAPIAPQTVQEIKEWKITAGDNFMDVDLPTLLQNIQYWIDPSIKEEYQQACKNFPVAKANLGKAWMAWNLGDKQKDPPISPKTPAPPVPKESLTNGVDYAGKLLPHLTSTGDASYYDTVAYMQKPLLDVSKNSEYDDIFNRAVEILNGLFDLRLQDMDLPDHRPTALALSLTAYLTYDITPDMFVRSESRNTANLSPGLGGIDVDKSVENISRTTHIAEDTVRQYIAQAFGAWSITPKAAGHLVALNNVADALTALGSNPPAYLH